MISTAFVDGMVLAAIVLDAREGALASASPGLARAFAARLTELDALSRGGRHQLLRRLIAELAAVPRGAVLSARESGVLASEVTSPLGRAHAVAALRRDFRPSPSLTTALRRLAAPPDTDTDSESEDRAACAEIDRALGTERAAGVRRWAETLGAGDDERALGALRLGVEGRRDGDARSRRLRAIGGELAEVWRAAWGA